MASRSITQTIEERNTSRTLRLSYKGSRATTEQTKHKVPKCDKQKKYYHGNPSKDIADLESSHFIENFQSESNKTFEKGINSLAKTTADLESSNNISVLEILEIQTDKESGKGVKQLYIETNNNVGKSVVTENLKQKKYFQGNSSRGNADLKSTVIIDVLKGKRNKQPEHGLNSLSKVIAESDLESSNTILILEISEMEIDVKSGKAIEYLPKFDADQETTYSISISEQTEISYKLPLYVREQRCDEPENINIHNIDAINTQNIQSFVPSDLRSRRFLAGLVQAIGFYRLLEGMGGWIERRRNEEGKRSWNDFLKFSSSIVYTKDEMLFLSLQKGSVSVSTSDVVHHYYLIISREHGYNSSKIYTSDVFEEALRECGIGPLQITYTIIFPNDCRMFLLVPVYKGGYLNNIDQKDKPHLNRTAFQQNELNMETFNSAPKWCRNGTRSSSKRTLSSANSLI